VKSTGKRPHKIRDFRFRFGKIDGEHFKRPPCQLALQFLHGGHLVAAGLAPGRPEIQQDNFAAVIRKVDRRAFQVLEHETRRLAAGPRLEIGSRGSRPKHRESERGDTAAQQKSTTAHMIASAADASEPPPAPGLADQADASSREVI
jgi:hypothetical protein